MPKYTFISSNAEGEEYIRFHSYNVEFREVLHDFEDFLKGCGFLIDGHLEIVENPDESNASIDDQLNKIDKIIQGAGKFKPLIEPKQKKKRRKK